MVDRRLSFTYPPPGRPPDSLDTSHAAIRATHVFWPQLSTALELLQRRRKRSSPGFGLAECANLALTSSLCLDTRIPVVCLNNHHSAFYIDLREPLLTNHKERRQIGWFYWSRHDTQKMGTHRVTRENLGAFWKHRNGQYRTITGLCRNRRGGFAVRLEMWIPDTNTTSAWNGMLSG